MSLSYKLRYLRSLKVATGENEPRPSDDVGEAINTNRDALISSANVGRAVLVREIMASLGA